MDPWASVTTRHIDRQAPRRRLLLDATSWVELVEGFVPDAEAVFGAVHDAAPWRQTEVLRYDRYVPERRLGAVLRPDGAGVLRQTHLHLRSTYRAPLEGVAALLYRTGEDFQGLHRDRELRWLDDTLIAIVVLGERRPFVLRPWRPATGGAARVPAGAGPDDIVLTPGDGDLLVMGGACQRDWLHGIPPAATSRPRISLTWRWTSRRGRPDTNPGYLEGRQFSDRPRRPGTRSRLV